ncbi:MAG TPA: hypothetical protein VHD33_05580 [Legionellaceae bacterium]|nr:hypothetical protein [Legionellaceae bacterium]
MNEIASLIKTDSDLAGERLRSYFATRLMVSIVLGGISCVMIPVFGLWTLLLALPSGLAAIYYSGKLNEADWIRGYMGWPDGYDVIRMSWMVNWWGGAHNIFCVIS